MLSPLFFKFERDVKDKVFDAFFQIKNPVFYVRLIIGTFKPADLYGTITNPPVNIVHNLNSLAIFPEIA